MQSEALPPSSLETNPRVCHQRASRHRILGCLLVSPQHRHHVVRHVQYQRDGQDGDAPPSGNEGEDSAEAMNGTAPTKGKGRVLLAAAEGLEL